MFIFSFWTKLYTISEDLSYHKWDPINTLLYFTYKGISNNDNNHPQTKYPVI